MKTNDSLLTKLEAQYKHLLRYGYPRKMRFRAQMPIDIYRLLNEECHRLHHCNLKRWAKMRKLNIRFYKKQKNGFVKI